MLSVLDIARRIDAGTLAPADALALGEPAIAAREAQIGAFVCRPAQLTPGRGPLSGIAVGVKDIIETADLPTAMGTPIHEKRPPAGDASIVALVRRAGGSVAGKTVTTPMAYLDPAGTRNPRNEAHTPGGSSSGSAAAVAAGFLPLAIGTQTGGSIIRPASYCGVAAVKPSFRLLPPVGIKVFSWTLDTPGLFAASVADAAYALSAITGRPDLKVGDEDGAAPHLAVVTQDFAGEPEPASAQALDEAVRLAQRAGARITRLSLAPIFKYAFDAHPTIQDVEARQALAFEYDHHHEALPPLLRGMLDAARNIPLEAFDAARRTAKIARRAAADVTGGVDAILTFSAPGDAPRGLGSTGSARFNRLWTLLGLPCVNVPGLTASSGLPVGLQVVGAHGKDHIALKVAHWLEAEIARSR